MCYRCHNTSIGALDNKRPHNYHTQLQYPGWIYIWQGRAHKLFFWIWIVTELGINSSVSTTCMYYLKHIKHKSSIIFIFHVLSLRTMKTQSRGVPWGTSRHPQMCLKTFSIHGEDFHYFHMARISYIFNVHAEYLPFCRENFLKLKSSLVHTRALPHTSIFFKHTFILLHFTLCLT